LYSDAFLQFKILSLGSLGFGFITSLIFLATVNEKKLTQGFSLYYSKPISLKIVRKSRKRSNQKLEQTHQKLKELFSSGFQTLELMTLKMRIQHHFILQGKP